MSHPCSWAASLLALSSTLLATAAAAQPAAESGPRYLAAMRAELEALELPAACEAVSATRGRCSFRHVDPRALREHFVHLVYSDSTDTIYMYIPRFVVAPPEEPQTAAFLRRLMELNWAMLGAKLEWSASDGEVRLSAVLHTDSNFDRRAFRNLLRALLHLSDRHYPELDRLALPQDDD